MESEFNARSQLRGAGSARGWGMEKFRPPVPRAAAARKHQANGCSRVGREKPASRPLEMRPPTMVWLVTSVREQQEQGCSTREDKPGARSDPSPGGDPPDPGTVPQYLSRDREGTGDEATYKVGLESV